MCCTQMTDRKYNSLGWGLLAILWGITILFDFIPFGAGLVGTGLILLGANALLASRGRAARNDNSVFGILALVWGGLELARPLLLQISATGDWDWGIFAILLVTLGLIMTIRALVRPSQQNST